MAGPRGAAAWAGTRCWAVALAAQLLLELRQGLTGLVVLFWPGPCAVCGGDLPGRALAGVCPGCWAALPVRRGPGCPRCDLPAPGLLVPDHCPDCSAFGAGALERTVAAFVYREGVITLHRRLKFQGAVALARPLAALMVEAWRRRGRIAVDLVTRVPPDPLRWTPRRRAPLRLARQASRLLGVPFAPRAMRKVRPTRSLTGRGQSARRAALAGVFRADPLQVAGRRVLVVDDVVTTGATLHEAARSLAAAGAARVAALVLARTPALPAPSFAHGDSAGYDRGARPRNGGPP